MFTCAICETPVKGEIWIREGSLNDGTAFVLIIRSHDCDWMSCDGCGAIVHLRCYQHIDIKYCGRCVDRLKLHDFRRQ